MTSPEYAGPKALGRLLDAVLSVNAGLDLPTILERIVEAATDLVDARYGALGVLDEERTHLVQFVTVGLDDEQRAAIGELPKGHGILGLLIVEPRPIRLPDLREHPDSYGFPPNHPPMKSFLGVPITIRNEVFGNLYLTDKTSAETFSDVDQELVVALAAAAGIAIENARLHHRVRDVALLEDRERIARDLHDSVIQRLFAVGLSLQGATRLVNDPAVQDRIESAVEDLDLTVKHIRTAIFGLESRPGTTQSARQRLLDLAAEAGGTLGFEPKIVFEGAIDAIVTGTVLDNLVATAREALTNVARHAGATAVLATVKASDEVVLEVSDDGRGIEPTAGASTDSDDGDPAQAGGKGLRNMARRAESLGGRLEVETGPGAGPAAETAGTTIRWTVPAR